MILRRLRVEHFRRHNFPVDIEFDERLTIVAGLNEAGKTTLFEALQYAFFRRSGATGKDIETLAPWGRPGLSPAVTVDFEHKGAEYQLFKNWGKRGGTQLSKRNASGLFVPDMAENADDFLATVFAGQPSKQGQFSSFTGQHMGLAYLLFVPQGRVPIAGATKEIGLHTDAQARLTEILGAASQSPEAARLGKAISTAYDKVFTSKGQRRAGAPAVLVDAEITKLNARVEEMRRQLDSFNSSAEALDAAREALQTAGDAAEAAKTAAEASRPRYQAAVDLKALLAAAEGQLQQAQQRYDALIEEGRQLEDALRKLEELRPEHEARVAAVVDAETAHADADSELSEAVRAFRIATAPDPELERLERDLKAARDVAELRKEADRLKHRVADAQVLVQRLGEIDSACAREIPVTEAGVDHLRLLVETERGLKIRLEAAQTSFALVPERSLSIAWHSGDQDKQKELNAGERFEVAADGRLVLELDGVARIEIQGPVNNVGELRAEISNCQRSLAELESALGTRDPGELQKRLNAQKERDQERAWRQGQLEELLDGKTVENLEQALRELHASFAPTPDAVSVEELDALLSKRKSAATSSIAELSAEIETLTGHVEQLHDDLVTAQEAESAIDAEWRRLEGIVARLLPEGESPVDRNPQLNAAYAKRFEAERKVDEARAAYAPYCSDADPVDELNRLQDLADQTIRDEMTARARVEELERRLADGYDEAPASQLTELEEELERLRAKLADEEVTEAALRLLQTFVTEADAKRFANFAQPVLEHVAPWFQQVTGNELMRLDLTGDNEVTGLRLAGVDHEVQFRELSQGTCDQLALLIRLAFASLLTQPQCLGPMPVMLDDPLVHADWERRPRFGKILEDISSTAQVIVFTCRPEDYANTPARLITLGEPDPKNPAVIAQATAGAA